ncbi:MAG: hypothetical protein EB107_06670, partial [Proteobacteria bacterium]|nr:hypothetical protein [Pseudomonadota bacterium]
MGGAVAGHLAYSGDAAHLERSDGLDGGRTFRCDSGTGWPSFTRPVEDDAVGAREDDSHGMRRIEVVCRSCGG